MLFKHTLTPGSNSCCPGLGEKPLQKGPKGCSWVHHLILGVEMYPWETDSSISCNFSTLVMWFSPDPLDLLDMAGSSGEAGDAERWSHEHPQTSLADALAPIPSKIQVRYESAWNWIHSQLCGVIFGYMFGSFCGCVLYECVFVVIHSCAYHLHQRSSATQIFWVDSRILAAKPLR